jgi:Zn-dependent peptidase ImmA (M78 family)
MSALDWEEYHANMYAKFILMPKKFVVELFTTYRKDKFPTRKITKAHAKRAWAIIIEVADYLGVSHTAMAYRVKELGLISEEVFDAMELKQYAT